MAAVATVVHRHHHEQNEHGTLFHGVTPGRHQSGDGDGARKDLSFEANIPQERLAQLNSVATKCELELIERLSEHAGKIQASQLDQELYHEFGTGDDFKASLIALSETRHWLVDHAVFSSTITFLVLVNAVQMGLEVDHPEHASVWKVCDYTFAAIFIIEMILKLICLHFAYFKDRWNCLDGSLAILGFCDTWLLLLMGTDSIGLSQLSILRIL